jgi:putative hemolysin
VRLMEKPRYLIATLSVLQTFFSVLFILVIGYLLVEVSIINFSDLHIWMLVPEIILLSVLMIVLKHIIPKTFAEKNNVAWTLWTLPGLFFLEKIFHPLTMLSMRGVSVESSPDNELKNHEVKIYGVDSAPEPQATEKQEAKFLKGVLKFGSTNVKEVMKPRIDMIALDADKSFDEILKVVKDSGYSRIPVYRNSMDNIVGILYTKDLLQFLRVESEISWLKILRPAFFIPEGKRISDLLMEFQRQMLHIAIAVDEYGSTAGVITLEDILEEIIGEIRDELDDKTELDYAQLDADNFVFEGKTLLNDMYRAMGIKNNPFENVKGDVDSIGGLILELSGKIPQANEEIDFNNFRFKVLNMDNHRIRKVKVTRTQEEIIS